MSEKTDFSALYKIGYGLYAVSSNDGTRDNALIVNTVMQLTSSPVRIAVTINKENYSHGVIKKSGIMNVNCLDEGAPFSLFQEFGFKSGREVDKFKGREALRSDNGLVVLPRHINAYMSLSVEDYIDLGTHGMFVCSLSQAAVVSDSPGMTYEYYHKNVKPKPEVQNKKGYICKICGYIHDEEELPDDFICPICKHGREDFEELK